MTKTVEVDWRKCKFSSFEELSRETFEAAMQFGRNLLQGILEEQDEELREKRDKQRYREKGTRSTCVKTKLGAVEYKRRMYEDLSITEGLRHVYLLDEALNMDLIGNVAPDVCEEIARLVCKTSYRNASRILEGTTGLSLSPQGVWNIAQQLGERRSEQVDRMAALARGGKGAGRIETKVLYEENDGI